ncbi:MAG: hypothetical protein HFG80_02425 [Eubacterium sp.]|jgi:flagellar capping protein FliD|nr:hypothetical protein [Eubacterium sp.]
MSLTVSSLSTLFGGLGGSSSNSVGMDASFLSDYSSIRNGSYYKLLKAYYSQDSDGSKTSATRAKISNNNKEAVANRTSIKKMNTTASDLKSKTYDLMRTGSKSLFKTKEVKQDDGTVKQEYDADAIYKGVKAFVDSYNAVIEQADKVDNSSVKRSTISMINTTASNEKRLAELGITVGSDYQLTINESAFKDADMSKAQYLFQGNGSYAARVSAHSSNIMNYSVSALNSGGMYSSHGAYSSADLVGSLYSKGI